MPRLKADRVGQWPGRIAVTVLFSVAAMGCAGPSERPTMAPSPNDRGIVAEVVSYQLVGGQPGRLLVALLTADNRWVSFGSVAASFRYLGDRASGPSPDVSAADATAAFLPIPGSPQGDGRPPTLTFPADGRGVYAVEPITFPRAGYWQVRALGQLADGSRIDADAAFTVLDVPAVIGVGMRAPRSENPVLGDLSVPAPALDSRAVGGEPIPDPELHRVSIADALDAGHAALVVFSTPVYCVSRFCGPVTDLVAELAATYSDRADFIHIEIYRDFQAGQVSQTAHDWLSTPDGDLREPWTFLIAKDGRIAASWDTVVTRGEIEPLLRALPAR